MTYPTTPGALCLSLALNADLYVRLRSYHRFPTCFTSSPSPKAVHCNTADDETVLVYKVRLV